MTAATAFLPAERSARSKLREERRAFATDPLLAVAFRAAPEPFLIVNRWRQVVYANPALEALAGPGSGPLLGRRPGEIIGCARAAGAPGGCGTGEACAACGAAGAMRAALEGVGAVREARVSTERGECMDLRVTAHPIAMGSRPFALVAITDISAEKRRRALERIFFHDVLNTAGAVRSISQLMAALPDGERAELFPLLDETSARLIEEIEAQRLLTAAEADDLVARPGPVHSVEALRRVAGLMRAHEAAEGRRLVVAPDAADVEFDSDALILGRVLMNLTKNALEASGPGMQVTLDSRLTPSSVDLQVHNLGAMSPGVQLQVFNRSFSTKGPDRGLGTYGARLLAERYLGSRVWFVSREDEGTTFTVSCPLRPAGGRRAG